MRAILRSQFLTDPEEGRKAIPIVLDFTNIGVVTGDLEQEMTSGNFSNVQTVWVDNSLNAAPLLLINQQFGTLGHTVQVQAFEQGYFPFPCEGPLYYVAQTAQGIKISIEFLNHAMPYVQWGPAAGVTVTPVLTNIPIELAAAAIGDNVLVAGVLGQSIKVYRMLFVTAQPTNIKFWSNPAATAHALSGTLDFTAGGSMTIQPSGIPWFTTQAGESFNMNSSAAVNIGGVLGYVQS